MKYELRSSKQYDKWFAKLKDSSIKIKVLARLDRVENGNFGDFKQIGSNLFELRFFLAAACEFTTPPKMAGYSFCWSVETNPRSPKTAKDSLRDVPWLAGRSLIY